MKCIGGGYENIHKDDLRLEKDRNNDIQINRDNCRLKTNKPTSIDKKRSTWIKGEIGANRFGENADTKG